jgi:phage-related baseplate assembly protein
MRNPEYKFVSTDTEELISRLVAAYEIIMDTSVKPASPDKLFILWVANEIVQERVLNNWTGNQNLPSRAQGGDLDELGKRFYNVARPQAQPAVCTERFYISQAQDTSIPISKGTRVTDVSSTLVWETVADTYIAIGAVYADVALRCLAAGIAGNGYAIGQINTLVDISNIAYYDHCENLTVSDGGADTASDDAYYELMRAGMGAFSVAGPLDSYIYHVKKVSTEIADIVANSPAPGQVSLYILMDDGTIAGAEVKNKAVEACNAKDVRPLTDYVVAADPETVSYDIDFTYYISINDPPGIKKIEDAVNAAVEDYKTWQCGKFGRDINPSYMEYLLMKTGIKRVVITQPVFVSLRDGKDDTAPQIAAVNSVEITNGGYEDA